MKNRIISAIIALLIAGSGSSKNISRAYASEKRNKVSIENTDFKFKVEDTFGWTNLDKEIILGDSLMFFAATIDNKRYAHVALTEIINDGNNILFTEIETDQPIFEILLTNSNSNVFISKMFDYFVKGAIIENVDIILFDKNEFEYGNQESIPDDLSQPMTIYRLAELLFEDKFVDKKSWYNKSKIKTFDDLEYKNTAPNINDNEYIKLNELCIIFHPAKKIEYDGLDNPNRNVVMFAKETPGTDGYKLDDAFFGINLMHFEPTKKGTLTGYYNSIFDKSGTLGSCSVDEFVQQIYPEATSYFRDIVEEIDGEKYFNVGKLRKIYENLDPNMMVDYDKLLNMDTSKFLPVSKNINNDKVLHAIDKPKNKELTKKS